jgi:maltooligosyltrehalose trehalohydrolase
VQAAARPWIRQIEHFWPHGIVTGVFISIQLVWQVHCYRTDDKTYVRSSSAPQFSRDTTSRHTTKCGCRPRRKYWQRLKYFERPLLRSQSPSRRLIEGKVIGRTRKSQLDGNQRALGALLQNEGVVFRLWAPEARHVDLVLESAGKTLPMESVGEGFYERHVPHLKPGALYRYRLNGETTLPDPASRYQPQGVHGPSQVIDPAQYAWRDGEWPGLPQRDLVFYELHIGAFTNEGTFASAAKRLPYLKQLGLTALQVMPVADFPGRWNWGYDPAAFFAPSRTYGSPDDLRALVDSAHQLGMAVFLDVVYNHFGPDGSYAPVFGKFFTDKHRSPWGQGVNLDDLHSEGVRNFFIDNALHWLLEYHFDGLRLDATHALQDESDPHFLTQLGEAVGSLDGRKRYLIAEDERNLASLVRPRSAGGYGLDAVWADDFHHQIRNVTAGDSDGYFSDFAATTAADIAATLRQGWFYTGQLSPHHGRPRGTKPAGIPLERFVICIQNHDQVGNRPTGSRLHHEIPHSLYRAVSALLLFGPELPLLFMGQEWATESPFQFFTDHNEELGRLVTAGRKREFRGFAGFQGEVPDPQDPATFQRSILNWDELQEWPHRGVHALYRDLLMLRPQIQGEPEIEVQGDRALALRRGRHHLLLALADGQRLPVPPETDVLLQTEQSEYAVDGQPVSFSEGHAFFPRAAAVVCLSRAS